MIRLLALDVDGTLLDSQHRLSARVREALHLAADAGTQVVLTSARGPGGLRPVLRALGLGGYAVSLAGALVCAVRPNGAAAVLDELRMDLAAAREVVLRARQLGVSVGWWDSIEWLVDEVDEVIRREERIIELTPRRADLAGLETPPLKLQCMVGMEHVDRLEALRVALPPRAVGSFSNPNYLEVLAPGVDKASGLQRLGQRLGVTAAEMAAIGDGENDVPMLRFVGLGVAVANARPAVLQAAHWTVPSNDEDGVALALQRMILAGRLPTRT